MASQICDKFKILQHLATHRPNLLSFQGFNQGGFFATNVGSGATMKIDVEVITTSTGVRSNQPGSIRFSDGNL